MTPLSACAPAEHGKFCRAAKRLPAAGDTGDRSQRSPRSPRAPQWSGQETRSALIHDRTCHRHPWRPRAEFRAALEHVVGPQAQLETVSIGPDDDAAVRRGQMVEAVHRIDTGNGVILLTDMFGGTPSNLAISVMDEATPR